MYLAPQDQRPRHQEQPSFTTVNNTFLGESFSNGPVTPLQTNNSTGRFFKKSPSMKKLRDFSKQLQEDANIALMKLSRHKPKNEINFPLTQRKKPELFRNSSLGNFQLKRNSSLKDMILTTETKSKYVHRSNSKIMKNISHMRQEFEEENRRNERSFLAGNNTYTNRAKDNKKNFFDLTTRLLSKGNSSNLPTYSNKTYTNSNTRKKFINIDFDRSYLNLKPF